MKKTLFSKTSPDVRSGGEIPCPDVKIEWHAKDASKDLALPRVIDLMMVGAKGHALDTVIDASLNSEVHVHRLSINGTVPALDIVVDASLNNEVPAHRVNVDGSVDGSVPAPQQVHQASPVDDHLIPPAKIMVLVYCPLMHL
ncbi:hypothetical protein L7F22_012546, partial [Adiantum nelumboides]|nr:hypothetical protein [Adiantum nelumboides]